MLDQVKTGKFIAQLRKEKGLTQKELADSLGISDKAVSKWETGNGMPDVSLMQSICEIFDININELLSGERLSIESYNGKAEENMMKLAESAQKGQKEQRKASAIQTVGGLILLLLFAEFALVSAGGVLGNIYVIDFPTFLMITGIAGGILLASGSMGDFFKAFQVAVRGGDELTQTEIAICAGAMKLAMQAVGVSGGIAIVVSIIVFLHNLSDLATVGPCFAVMCVSILYSLLYIGIFLAFYARLKKILLMVSDH